MSPWQVGGGLAIFRLRDDVTSYFTSWFLIFSAVPFP